MKTAAQMMKSLKVDSFVYSTGTDLSSAGVAHVPEVDIKIVLIKQEHDEANKDGSVRDTAWIVKLFYWKQNLLEVAKTIHSMTELHWLTGGAEGRGQQSCFSVWMYIGVFENSKNKVVSIREKVLTLQKKIVIRLQE